MPPAGFATVAALLNRLAEPRLDPEVRLDLIKRMHHMLDYGTLEQAERTVSSSNGGSRSTYFAPSHLSIHDPSEQR